MTVRDPDPFADHCPLVSDCNKKQLIDLLDGWYEVPGLREWERDFCRSMLGQLINWGRRPTERQAAVLDKLLPRLWAGDPDLWPRLDEKAEERAWKIALVRQNNAEWAAKLNNRPFLPPEPVVDEDEDEQYDLGRRTVHGARLRDQRGAS